MLGPGHFGEGSHGLDGWRAYPVPTSDSVPTTSDSPAKHLTAQARPSPTKKPPPGEELAGRGLTGVALLLLAPWV